jgi:C_GCAxxG_C_C family probable redox protein
MNKQQQASDYFQNSFNCSQSVFTVFATDYGIPEDDSLRIACAFGAGMGRQQYTCGAVTGALMAIGLKYGKGRNDDESRKKETYEKALEFLTEFKKIHGSVNCRELLRGLNMNNPDDFKKIKEANLFETLCGQYVEDAVAITEKLISNPVE